MTIHVVYTRRMAEFVKRNTTAYPDALEREAEGLELLAEALSTSAATSEGTDGQMLRVPTVLSVTEAELVLPRIECGSSTGAAMRALGQGLARLHRLPQPRYGLANDNMIGLARQLNRWCDDWGEFFVQDRLRVQIERMTDSRVREEFREALDAKASALKDFLNTHCDQPSLLHGDLWSGNVLFDGQGPWLIDPAVYCGDREADIAMTELFGGFSADFYQAYDQVYPRSSVYPTKRAIYNLYHTLNHYNLFGSGYLGACRKNLEVIRALR